MKSSGRVVAFGPGRVNLIGEHTDYNDGLSLPFAIEQGVTVTATRAEGAELELHALDLGESDRFAVDAPQPADGWRAFGRGVAAELQGAGFAVGAASLQIEGTVPRGSGLSSSAALEVALCLAVLGLAGVTPDRDERLDLARLCSRVENEWVGAQTGLLDQVASLLGEEGQALRIDFRTLDVELVPLRIGEWTLATLDSGEQHANAAGGYNERRAECARACELLGIETLRDATPESVAQLPEPLDRRVRHVVEENARVDATVRALHDDDLRAVGALLDASHASLRDDYEASTPAVERAVGRLKDAGAVGARMVGGGFGGHVLGLFAPGAQPPEGAVEVAPGAGARLLEDA